MDSIRILSSNPRTHVDVIAVYDHQVIVRRMHKRIVVECAKVTAIGNVPCVYLSQGQLSCWHSQMAINLIAKDLSMGWYYDYNSAWWAWATDINRKLYTVESGTSRAWIVMSNHEQ
jgi:hypothetical protein